MGKMHRAWLPFLDGDVPADCGSGFDVAAFELGLGCGGPFDPHHYVSYLKNKYGTLYGL